MGHRPWSQVKRSKIPPEERIAYAMEAGIRRWLRDDLRWREETIEELLDSWALEAAARGPDRHDRRYWDEARPWLEDWERGH